MIPETISDVVVLCGLFVAIAALLVLFCALAVVAA